MTARKVPVDNHNLIGPRMPIPAKSESRLCFPVSWWRLGGVWALVGVLGTVLARLNRLRKPSAAEPA